MEEEKLGAQAAVVAVLKDNLHGLELDERCTQIAAFNVALTAWKLAGYQLLPSLHLACSGLAPSATEAEWVTLAGDNERARKGMASLHRLFQNAPVLGSLISPRAQDGDLFIADFQELTPLLAAALAQGENQKTKSEDDDIEWGVIAQGLAKAVELLAGLYTLVITNVPYLGRRNQGEAMANFSERYASDARHDLATVFLQRSLDFCSSGGNVALVEPQAWLFLGAYEGFRERMLKTTSWNWVARLGTGAFETIGGEVVNVALICMCRRAFSPENRICGWDASSVSTPGDKASAIQCVETNVTLQIEQLKNPDHRFILTESSKLPLLGKYAFAVQGLMPADRSRFVRAFSENPAAPQGWKFLQGSIKYTAPVAGRHQLIDYVMFEKQVDSIGGRLQGMKAWDHHGVGIAPMSRLPVTVYTGEPFDGNVHALIPIHTQNLPAIWEFCSSSSFVHEIRKVDQKLGVTCATVVKVPFDLANWQKIAAEKYPNGLPKPHSNDPTQWLFNGHPKGSEQPLHVAVARLLGYRWPRQTGSSFPDCPALDPDGLEPFADEDGIVCLPPLNREQPAASRLRQLLTAALGAFDERALIAAAGLKGGKSATLEDWLRDEFFEQHAKLFHDRPFIWHLWDGRPDGFHVLVNYHQLDHATLQKLTYSYLGNWIQQQDEDAKADKPGAAARLGAARALQAKLAAILEGEAPLDVFVRWKPLKEQAQGWHPDLNDGIRQNIRPFLLAGDVGKRGAGLFRAVPLKLKDKDRGNEPRRPKADYPWFWCAEKPGTDPQGGEEFVGSRWNSVHLTLARKKEACS